MSDRAGKSTAGGARNRTGRVAAVAPVSALRFLRPRFVALGYIYYILASLQCRLWAMRFCFCGLRGAALAPGVWSKEWRLMCFPSSEFF
jgi:hypothetical protein